MKTQPFRENVIVITGASYGIGKHLALQFAARGAWLALAARSADRLDQVSQLCRRRGGKSLVIPTDVGEKSQCRNLIARTVAAYGRVDTLINNAGFGLAARFDALDDLALFEKVIQVNFFGSVYCTHYALPYLKESRGRLVAVSSLLGRLPSAAANGYSASKHALAGFFDSLRIELSGSGVSVTVIYPGWVNTGISSRTLNVAGEQTGTISSHEKDAMPVDDCARLIVRAAAARKREVVMTAQGKYGLWLRLIAPGVVDRMIKNSVEG